MTLDLKPPAVAPATTEFNFICGPCSLEHGFHSRADAQLFATEHGRVHALLDAYHQSYRHGPDPDPKLCPGCQAAALEDA